MKKKGFTLVEIVVVLAIIGILAAAIVPMMMNYTKKAKLKSENSNAKLVYTTVNTQVADMLAHEEEIDASCGLTTPTKITDLSTAGTTAADKIKNAVYDAVAKNGIGSGVCTYFIDDKGNVTAAQWGETESATQQQIVGQYPNPEDDYSVLHNMGTVF